MQYFFNFGPDVLAKPLASDFEKFKKEVYRELYALWANGFENDKSDISGMALPGQIPFICDEECVNLESYMKLICLHLIFTRNLPYVNLNFTGLPLQLGIRAEMNVYEENVERVVSALQMTAADRFGKVFDLKQGVPDELLRISLNDEFRAVLEKKNSDFRENVQKAQNAWLNDLKEKSLEVFGQIPMRRKASKTAKPSQSRYPKHKILSDGDSKKQQKGSPVAGGSDKGGNK